MTRSRVAIIAAAIMVMVAAPWFVFGVHLPRFVTADGALDRRLCARSVLPVSPPPGHVTVLIVDGLGFAYAMALPELAWLREAAAMRPLDVTYPSFTTPALLSFVTGVGPAESGIRLNAPTTTVTADLDNLRAAAAAMARPIDFFDGGWKPFGEIMFADDEVLWKGRRAMETAAFVSRPERSLRFVYFGDVDEAGHTHGEASPEFRAAAIQASRHLWRFYVRLQPNDRLLVVSDHGHLASGGHGGVEPEILRATFALLGRDARRGEVLAARPIDDVASTIATLAGVPTPACNRGRPMLDMLHLEPAIQAQLVAPALDQQRRLAAKIAPAPAVHPARRLGIAVLFTLALAGAIRHRWPPWSSWLTPLAFAGGYLGYLAIRGYRLTFSKMPPQPVFIADAIVACLIGVCLALGYAYRRNIAQADVAVLLGAAAPMLWMAAWVGVDPHVVPPPYVGLALILWSPALVASALMALVMVARPPRT